MIDPRPLPVELLASAHHRRTSGTSDRAEARKMILAMVGEAGMKAFLKARQPALGDRTGGELLQNAPGELLQRLRSIEAEDLSDEHLADPLVERHAQRRKESEASRVLDILDSLPPATGERRSA